MAHRVLTPSSPYTQPDSHPSQAQAYPQLATRPTSPTKLPIPLPFQHGKENSTSTSNNHRYSLPCPSPSLSQHAPSLSPNHSNYASALSSPKLSPFVATATAPSPTFYASRAAPAPAQPLPQPQPAQHQSQAKAMHYHRSTASTGAYPPVNEPTMTQLLAQQPTSLSSYANRMRERDGGDATMGQATGVVSWRKGQGFKEWEKVRLQSAEVRRKADVAQLCEFKSSARSSARD